MNKEFIPYEQALALKDLGFNEPCWAWWHIEDCDTRFCYSEQRSPIINSRETEIVGLPLYQQAFRWFREKHGLDIIKRPDIGKTKKYICDPINHRLESKNTYEEAEQACLNKLIEIVKNENNR